MQNPIERSAVRGSPGLLLVKLLLLAIPFLSIMAIYVGDDPFKVIGRYRFGNYYDDQVYELNRDYVSTEMFLANYPEAKFDTFILGSSRSFSYYCDDLRACLPGSRPFHYPAASEHLLGIYLKIRLLDRLGVELNNVLIVTDSGSLADITKRTDHLHYLHPRLSGDGWLGLEFASFKAFLASQFLYRYATYRLLGELRPFMQTIFIEKGRIRIDPETNDYYFEREELSLRTDPKGFYERRAYLFEKRDSSRRQIAIPVLEATHQSYLREMADIFRRQGTNVRIVISPLYDQVELNPVDLAILRKTFGTASVFDFSGVNEITNDMTNFYDPGHYRPFVATQIVKSAFDCTSLREHDVSRE